MNPRWAHGDRERVHDAATLAEGVSALLLWSRAAAIARLPLQLPLVWWAVRVMRGR